MKQGKLVIVEQQVDSISAGAIPAWDQRATKTVIPQHERLLKRDPLEDKLGTFYKEQNANNLPKSSKKR